MEEKQREIFYKQLALDYSCSKEDVASREHIFTKKEYREGRRIFRGDDCVLKIVSVNGKLLVSAEGDVLTWCEEHLKDKSAAWFFESKSIYELEEMLHKTGHRIASTHQFYLPGGVEAYDGKPPHDGIQLKWFEREDLDQFRENNPYPEALSFIAECPDMLAVMALDGEEVLAIAGASRDSEDMWQIGINVKKEGMGYGTYVVTLLKREIMKRGKLPFYGTAHSHVKSQKVGVQSGFLPAWAELYTEKIR